MRSFKIEVRGNTYQGAWATVGDDKVQVRSDLGQTSTYLDGRKPEDAARALLTAMVQRQHWPQLG